MDRARHIDQAHSRNMIVNVFHHDAPNIGDRLCGPGQFFWPGNDLRVSFDCGQSASERIVVGGGQVFAQTTYLSETWPKHLSKRQIAWGIGLPLKGKKDKLVRSVASRFGLFGTRNYDWRDEFQFVPCASCMSGIFDTVGDAEHNVVIYAHRKKTPDLQPQDGIPFLTNETTDALEAITFIASGETVVTSSYHGVYWAQLLGRRVICIPYNDKFSTYQHQPTTATAQTWRSALRSATRTAPLLEEYRSHNRSFAEAAQRILELDVA